MATILAQGVADTAGSDYSARRTVLDHEAYGIEHMVYNRWTPHGNQRETDEGPQTGHPPYVSRPPTARPGRAAPQGCEHRLGA
ncbi:hypothetical protein ACRAWF_04270 [Streptomyces sp. L7]